MGYLRFDLLKNNNKSHTKGFSLELCVCIVYYSINKLLNYYNTQFEWTIQFTFFFYIFFKEIKQIQFDFEKINYLT